MKNKLMILISPSSPSPPSSQHLADHSFKSPSSSASIDQSTPYQSSTSSVLSYSQSMEEETIAAVEPLISKWTSSQNSFKSLFINAEQEEYEHDRQEAETFILSVQDLQTAMKNLISTNFSALETLARGQQLLQAAMDRLQKEFFYLLKNNRQCLRPESLSNCLSTTPTAADIASPSRLSVKLSMSDSEEEIETAAEGENVLETESTRGTIRAMNDLKMIADCMIGSGYGKECVFVYNITRKYVVDEALYQIGLHRPGSSSSSPSIHNRRREANWDAVEPKIKRWLNAVEYAVKTIFNGERILCDHVFSSSAAIQESCFSEVTRDGAMALFAFPREIAADKKLWKKSPERIFQALDLYDAIANLGLGIVSTFSFNSTSAIRSLVESSLQLLGKAVKSMIKDFESTIVSDGSKVQAPGGGLHPLVRYVMNFLVSLADYDRPLSDILADWPLHPQACLPECCIEATGTDDGLPSNNVSERFAWLILVLLCKIDGKAEGYGDVALSYLFLANNLKYVVGKVRSSNLLGEGWLAAHKAKVSQYVANYVRVKWSKVVSALSGGCDPTAELSLKQAMECFERFNAAFYETYHKERQRTVPDWKLREEIRAEVARKVVAVYGKMYDKYRGPLAAVVADEGGVSSAVRLAPEDVEKHLSELLSGAASGSGSYSGRNGTSGFPMSSSHSSPSHSGARRRTAGPSSAGHYTASRW